MASVISSSPRADGLMRRTDSWIEASNMYTPTRARSLFGSRTRVVDSFIGPFSAVGNGCEVINSEIEHSVVMDDSKILDIARLEDSLIGSDAVVTRSRQRPRALRLMVGDHCQIDVE